MRPRSLSEVPILLECCYIFHQKFVKFSIMLLNFARICRNVSQMLSEFCRNSKSRRHIRDAVPKINENNIFRRIPTPTSDPPSDEYRVVHWNGGSSHRASFEARELRELRSIHHLV